MKLKIKSRPHFMYFKPSVLRTVNKNSGLMHFTLIYIYIYMYKEENIFIPDE